MNWDDLRYVLALCRSGTLAGAARAMKVDATTVGRRIGAIESELNARLFDRTASGFVPTVAGHAAIAHAEAIEKATLALVQRIEGSDLRVEGAVRLSGLDAAFDGLIIPRLPALLGRHPGLEVTFASNLGLVDLSRREADIALRNREPTHPDSVGRKLGRVAQAAYAARDLPLAPRPPLIALPGEHGESSFSKLLLTLFPEGRIVARGNTESHMHSLARSGIGIAVLDCFVGDRDPRLRRVLPDVVASQFVWAETHVAMARAPRIRVMLDFLRAIFNEEADALAGQSAA